MIYKIPDETKAGYIEKMGAALGTQYAALWQEVASLYIKWGEFVELFGTKSSRVDLLNQAAPAFFRMVQDLLLQEIFLHIARITDPSASMGRKDRQNLTIQNLPELIEDIVTRKAVTALVEAATKKTNFARDWRNRHIAHRDLDLATSESATPLAAASMEQVTNALSAIAKALNELSIRMLQSDNHFDHIPVIGGAVPLLHVLFLGINATVARQQRLAAGIYSEDDFPHDL